METTTPQTAPTVSAVAIRYGILTGIASIIFSFLLIISHQIGNSALGMLGLVILVGGIVLAQRDFRGRNAGFMSYGEGMGIGTLLSLVSGLLSTAFSFIYRAIDPSVAEQALEQARAKMEAGGNMNDEQIDQAIAISQKFSSGPIGFALGIVVAIFIGALLSLIISAILKRNKPEFE